jgi:pyridoxamine 5'-phosphate oxidase
VLEEKMKMLREKYKGKDIALPPHWGGYRLTPQEFEFWSESAAGRLHDRICYTKGRGGWTRTRLSP